MYQVSKIVVNYSTSVLNGLIQNYICSTCFWSGVVFLFFILFDCMFNSWFISYRICSKLYTWRVYIIILNLHITSSDAQCHQYTLCKFSFGKKCVFCQSSIFVVYSILVTTEDTVTQKSLESLLLVCLLKV